MKFRRSLVLSAAAALTLVGLHAPSMAQQRLRVAGNFPADHTATKVMEIFKKEVEARTKGELQVDLFPNMQLGGAAENVDQVRSGTVFAIVTSIAYFTRIVPEYEAVSLPFLFSSREAAFRVMDGPVGKLFDERMAQKGFISLGYGELGFRHVTNNVRPITSSADFKGLKIRLQPNEVHLDTFRALGANPVATSLVTVAESAAPLDFARRTVVETDATMTFADVLAKAGAPEPQAVLLGGMGGTWVPWSDLAGMSVDPWELRAAGLSLGAGILPNTRGTLIGWIGDSQSIKPNNRMPAYRSLQAAELNALAAYMESLK